MHGDARPQAAGCHTTCRRSRLPGVNACIHTDLACRNFLVFKLAQQPESTMVKITDFMNAICLPSNTCQTVRKMPQATRWCAPETVASNKWSYKTDVWSLGAALWELFAGGEVPWSCYSKRTDVAKRLLELAESPETSAADLNADFPAPESGECSPATRTALMSCLQPHARERPSARQLTAVLGTSIHNQRIVQDLASHVASSSSAKHSMQDLVSDVISSPSAKDRGIDSTSFPSSQHNQQTGPRSACAEVTSPPQSLAKALESSHPTPRSGGCMMTPPSPPTRCPSTPEDGQRTRRSSFASIGPDYALRTSTSAPMDSVQLHEGPLPSPASRFSLEVSQKLAGLGSVKACLSSPAKKNADLESLKVFLSCPEAVCGLDAESLISLRRRVAAAQDPKGYPAPVRGPIYDTIVPLYRTTR